MLFLLFIALAAALTPPYTYQCNEVPCTYIAVCQLPVCERCINETTCVQANGCAVQCAMNQTTNATCPACESVCPDSLCDGVDNCTVTCDETECGWACANANTCEEPACVVSGAAHLGAALLMSAVLFASTLL